MIFSSSSLVAIATFAFMLTEQAFAQANGIWGDLNQFIVGDEFQSQFECHLSWRLEDDVFVRPGGANVGQVFAAADVDHDVVVLAVLADDLAGVDAIVRSDEHRAAIG